MLKSFFYNLMILLPLGIGHALAVSPERMKIQPPASAPADAGSQAITDIHDIKPALPVGPDLQWLYWALGLLALAALAIVAWRLWKGRKTPRTAPAQPPPMAPDAEACQMLDALAADGSLEPKLFYFRLSAIVRRYIERRYYIPAAEMTSEELLPRIDRLPLGAEAARALKDFCRSSDPIKFAGAAAEHQRMAHDLAFARNFVHQTTAAVNAIAQGTAEETPPRPMAPAAMNPQLLDSGQ